MVRLEFGIGSIKNWFGWINLEMQMVDVETRYDTHKETMNKWIGHASQ